VRLLQQQQPVVSGRLQFLVVALEELLELWQHPLQSIIKKSLLYFFNLMPLFIDFIQSQPSSFGTLATTSGNTFGTFGQNSSTAQTGFGALAQQQGGSLFSSFSSRKQKYLFSCDYFDFL
jgi:hypothetical protein